jgi:hypothetical protein
MLRRPVLAALTALSLLPAAACAGGGAATGTAPTSAPPSPPADVTTLSDEFTDPAALARWQRFEPADSVKSAFEKVEVDAATGHLRVLPGPSVWYSTSRGVALTKLAGGDFTVTTRLRAGGRRIPDHPGGAFSLVGLMVRKPVADGGQENWIYLTTGSDQFGLPTVDSKSTVKSSSEYRLREGQWGWAELRVVRTGSSIVHLYRFGDGPWRLHRVVERADLAGPVQFGLALLTDYDELGADLDAEVDYVRFAVPSVPAGLAAKLAGGSATEAETVAALGG